MTSPITTHVLDTSTGRPAAGVPVRLERLDGGGFTVVGQGVTDDDGRQRSLLSGPLTRGTWRLRFDTGAYWARHDVTGFYPYVEVVFHVEAGREHYHVPLLLNPYGYSTYRGS